MSLCLQSKHFNDSNFADHQHLILDEFWLLVCFESFYYFTKSLRTTTFNYGIPKSIVFLQYNWNSKTWWNKHYIYNWMINYWTNLRNMFLKLCIRKHQKKKISPTWALASLLSWGVCYCCEEYSRYIYSLLLLPFPYLSQEIKMLGSSKYKSCKLH